MVAHSFKHQLLQLFHGHIILSRTTFLIPLGGAAAEILQSLSRIFADISRTCLLHCRTTVSAEHLSGQRIDLSLSAAAGVLPQHLYKLRQLVENAFFFLKAGVGLPRAIPKILPRLLLLSKFVVLLFDSLVIDDTVVAAVVDCNPIE